jgi:hypothetical protein
LLQHLSQIAGVYDHDSRCFHLTTLMLATSNLFEPVPVLIEAIEIAGIIEPLRLDFIESGYVSPRRSQVQNRPAWRTVRP